jgi:hypothetical protein
VLLGAVFLGLFIHACFCFLPLAAMRDFALAQSEWAATWPGEDDLAFRV